MTLNERLPELYGEQVKIGGSVGFFYCGDAFKGLEKVIDRIGESEKSRLAYASEQAKENYKNRDRIFDQKKYNATRSIEYETDRIEKIEWLMRFWEKTVSNSEYYLKTEKGWYWHKYFRVQKDMAKAKYEELRLQRHSASRTLRRNQIILDGLNQPWSKKNFEASLRKKLDDCIQEEDSFTTLSNCEIVDEYPIQSYSGTILILNTIISGKYWDKDECIRDLAFQRKVDRARIWYF